MMTAPYPVFGPEITDREPLADALGLRPADFAGHPAQIIDAGKPKILVALDDVDVLMRITTSMDEIERVCKSLVAEEVFLFAPSHGHRRYHARHFNPMALDREDPICGMGTLAMGAYLVQHGIADHGHIETEMGAAVGVRGRIFLDIADDLRVGGFACKLENQAW